LAVQLIPVVKDFLGQVYVQMHFPQVSTALGYVTPEGVSRKIRIFNHAGTTLVYASLLSYLLYRLAGWYQPGSVGRIVSGTLQRVLSSSLSIASMVAMAVIMENSGMTDALARGLAAGVGMYFPFVSPWIGALGSFMTGSNTNANVMFGVLQLQTANLLKYSAALILAAQTSGASLASVLAPSKVAVGASTAGMSGREGEVMRKLVIYVGLSVLLIGLMTVIGIWISG
jgi:lactate permease